MARAAKKRKDSQQVEAKMYAGFNAVIEQCDGCERVVAAASGNVCSSYTDPAAKWKLGICNFATHKKPEIIVVQIKVNPLKAAKRASKSK